jgi:hypothetical protein
MKRTSFGRNQKNPLNTDRIYIEKESYGKLPPRRTCRAIQRLRRISRIYPTHGRSRRHSGGKSPPPGNPPYLIRWNQLRFYVQQLSVSNNSTDCCLKDHALGISKDLPAFNVFIPSCPLFSPLAILPLTSPSRYFSDREQKYSIITLSNSILLRQCLVLKVSLLPLLSTSPLK